MWNKWIMIVVAACLLHNWCLMEDDEDVTSFDEVEQLEMDGHLGIPAAAIIGRWVACGAGRNKRDILCEIIQNLP